MSDAQLDVMTILKHWVLILRLGNNPSPEALAEIRSSIARMPEAEKAAVSALILDLLNDLDHGKN